MEMRTFVNTLESHEAFVKEITWHLEADAKARLKGKAVIVQQTYWEGNGVGKGCHVGCTLHHFAKKHDISQSDHSAYETLFGIPQTLARLFDVIHEGLDADETPAFLQAVRDTIKPNQDLSMVWPKLALWILAGEDNPHRLNQHESVKEAIGQVADVYRKWLEIGTPDSYAAADAAYAADAARAAARAAYAAYAAARAARAAYAADAADAARAAYAADAARAAARAADAADAAYAADFWPNLRDKLLQLIAETPTENTITES
jgi:hypothetical protein